MNINQIAAEAAKKVVMEIYDEEDAYAVMEQVAPIIIKAAIEKATIHLRQNLKDLAQAANDVRKERDQLRARDKAHASDPWTPNYVARLYAFAYSNEHSQRIAAMTRTFVTGWQAIADAHNASIGVKPAHASEPCDHQWVYAFTISSKGQPPIKIDQCVRCGVEQKSPAHASDPLPIGRTK